MTLPHSWAKSPLRDLCGFNPKHSSAIDGSTLISFVPMQAVDDTTGTITSGTPRPLSEVRTGYTHFADGDILFAKITPCMQNGKQAVASALLNGLGCGSTEFFVLRPNAGVARSYIHRYLRQRTFLDAAAASMTGVVGQARVPRDFLESAILPVPPAKEQARIASKIEALLSGNQRAADALNAVPPLLDRLRQSILAAAFRGDLTADWRARNPDVEPADKLLEKIRAERRRRWEAAELARLTAKGKPPVDDQWKERYPAAASRIEDSSQPPLPSGWVWVNLNELSWDAGYGTSAKCHYDVAGFAVLRIPNVAAGQLNLTDLKYATGDDTVGASDLVREGDFLIVRTNGSKDLIGRAAAISDPLSIAAYFASYLIRFRLAVPPVVIRWLGTIWASPNIRRALEGLAATSAGQYNVSLDKLNRVSIPLPPEEELKAMMPLLLTSLRSVEVLEGLRQSTGDLMGQLEQAILAKAFRGELVPQDPNDEPASVLLERLRAETAAAPAKPGRRTRTPVTTDATAASPARPVRAPRPSTPAAAAPTAPAPRPPLRFAGPPVDFLSLPPEAQVGEVHAVLLGEGPLERDEAVRRAAELLRTADRVDFKRLRSDGPLCTCIDAALASGLRSSRFDRPSPGNVRAIAREARDVPAPQWRRAVLAACAAQRPPADADAAVRAAAKWTQDQLGLEFQRLRSGSAIDTALRAALTELLAAGQVREHSGKLRITSL